MLAEGKRCFALRNGAFAERVGGLVKLFVPLQHQIDVVDERKKHQADIVDKKKSITRKKQTTKTRE